MAAITIQNIVTSGLTPAYGAAAAADTVAVTSSDRICVHVKNGAGSPITVTIPKVASTVTVPGYGSVSTADITATIAAGAEALIGPIPQGYVDPATGTAAVNYSSTTTITRTAYRIGTPA
jgi:hypothetical protein